MATTLIDALIAKNALPAQEASQIREETKEKGASPEEILYRHGITESAVAEAKSELTGYPIKNLEGIRLPFEVLKDIPEESARFYRIIPLGREEGYLNIGILAPEDSAAHEAIKFIAARLNLPPRIFIITPSDLEIVLREYHGLTGEVSKALGEFEKEQTAPEAPSPKREEKKKITEETPVIKIVGVILRHAIEGHASDVHIEPERERVRIRFRVDGILHTSLLLPPEVHASLVSRIKVMTNMKIDETRIPQDGRFHEKILDRDIDFRVSTLPTAFGEKVVIRVLDPTTGIATLPGIGLTGRNLTLIEENIKRPNGLVLITGPTGSGKSTTLYAALQILNQEGSNIISLEDPIEYYIPGVNQSQVRPEINYDFATGIRHVVRQDPDIIMVGEIRDKETAALAIHASLTGHLVLSTLHTNNATGVIPRLIDMGIDPYLIPPTLILAVGQRLVRTLCADSRKAIKLTGKLKDDIVREIETMPAHIRQEAEEALPDVIYQAEVSSSCPKGTRGRIGIFEVLSMTPELEKIILGGPSEAKILEEAQRQGVITMRQDGILKVLRGIIGLEELWEVV